MEHPGEGGVEDARLEVGIGGFLKPGDARAVVGGGVGRVLPEGENRGEGGRVRGVGGDVVDRRDALRRVIEIQGDPDQRQAEGETEQAPEGPPPGALPEREGEAEQGGEGGGERAV